MNFTTCPICNSKKVAFYLTTYDRHYGYFDRLFDVYQCETCYLLFLNPMIDEKTLNGMYPSESYYSYKEFNATNNLLDQFKDILKKILIGGNTYEPYLGYKAGQGMILDIGCGSGNVLYHLKKKGWKVAGVEINQKACEVANKNNLNVFHGNLIEAQYDAESFDYIRSNHSFEHLINPIETIREIKRICKKNGILFLGVPITKSLPFKIFRKYWYYLGIPFHPFNYNLENLLFLLAKHDFLIKCVRYVGNFNGLSGSLQIFLNRNKTKKSDEGFLNHIFYKIIFHQFARFLNLIHIGDCIEITAEKV